MLAARGSEYLKRRKYIASQIILYFFVSVAVFFALQFAFSLWGSHVLLNEMTDSASTNVNYMCQALENKATFVYSQLEYLLFNKDVPQLLRTAAMQPADYYLSIKDIQELLEMIRRSNHDLLSTTLYYPSLDVYISNAPSVISNNTSDYGRVNSEWLEARMQKSFSSKSFLFEEEDRFYITCSQQPQLRTQYYLEAELNMDSLYELLASYKSYQTTETLIYSHSSGRSYGASSVPEDICAHFRADTSAPYTFSFDDKLAVCNFSPKLQLTFVQLIPYEAWNQTTHLFSLFSVIFGLVVITIFVLYYGIIKRRISRPMQTITQSFQRLAQGGFDTQIDLNQLEQYEYYIIGEHFNDMSNQLRALIENKYQMTLRLQNAQLKQMQMQISPHFLYNTFHQFKHMLMHSDAESRENAISMAENLGTFFQYITSGESNVSLQEEYEHTCAYLRIQQLRFGDFMDVHLQDLPTAWQEVTVPRMILQPIFENAFKYGLHTHQDSMFQLSLALHIDEPYLRIYVEDNGNSLSDEQIQQINDRFKETDFIETDHALVNIHQRLRMFFKDESCGLKVSSGNNGGFKVTMTIRNARG